MRRHILSAAIFLLSLPLFGGNASARAEGTMFDEPWEMKSAYWSPIYGLVLFNYPLEAPCRNEFMGETIIHAFQMAIDKEPGVYRTGTYQAEYWSYSTLGSFSAALPLAWVEILASNNQSVSGIVNAYHRDYGSIAGEFKAEVCPPF